MEFGCFLETRFLPAIYISFKQFCPYRWTVLGLTLSGLINDGQFLINRVRKKDLHNFYDKEHDRPVIFSIIISITHTFFTSWIDRSGSMSE